MNNRRRAYSNSILCLGSLLLACANVSEPGTFASDSSTGGSTSTTNGGSSNAGASNNGGSSVGGSSSTAAKTTGGTTSASGMGGMSNGTGGTPYVPPSSSISLPYTDDFEDGSLNGWLVWNSSSSALGSWAITSDGTSNVLQQSNSGSSATWEVGGDVKWTDQAFSVKAKWADTSTYIYVSVRFNNTDGYYYLQTVPGSKPKIRVRNSGSTNDVCAGTTNFAGTAGTWYTITVTAQGSTFSAAIDGVSVCSATDTGFANGGIAVGTDGGPASFDDVSVTAP